jgi:Sulfatase
MNFLFAKLSTANEKPALIFLLKLLILASVLKCIFFFHNYVISGGWFIDSGNDLSLILRWSFLYDTLLLTLINLPLLLMVFVAGKHLQKKVNRIILAIVFAALNTFLVFLNAVDIFYYRFHLQRADADLMYVLRNPFTNGTINAMAIVLTIVTFCIATGWLIYKSIVKITKHVSPSNRFGFTTGILLLFTGLFFITGTKKLLPTYPLTSIKPAQLPLVQNSLHTFIYSLYRRNESVIPVAKYMPAGQLESLFSIRKKSAVATAPKNIVLFIMESVPNDFFDISSPYKVAMPFLDSLVNKSTFFNRAFSYSYNSNKGITAILAGIPTIIDIPLYHSNYTSVNRTAVGDALGKNQYSSAFFIGDNYDDFGFAKCCKWLGIQQYYCMEDIPGYRQMEKHTMGLHDEYVLNFMQEKLAKMQEPFFAVQYNISTHYPNDLPKSFNDNFPAINTTAPMKSMQYFNDCLQQFFREASTKSWYNNAVFIFCSDHWAQPHTESINLDQVESFRIPMFIYEPGNERKKVISAPVSQLDILNTVLHFGAVQDSFISYGENLTDTLLPSERVVFTKINGAVYQAINDKFVLGFNALEGKPLYCYQYINDPQKKHNLLEQSANAIPSHLLLQMKAFLQTAAGHYRNK